jgi:hypothetical protein
MTRDEAIAIRERQLQGGYVHAEVFAEALAVIRAPARAEKIEIPQNELIGEGGRAPRPRKQLKPRADIGKAREGIPKKVLELLIEQPVSRPEVQKAIPGASQTVRYMVKRGWIKLTVMLSLTDDGREALQ